MKKKTRWIVALTVILALCGALAFGLTGCNDDKNLIVSTMFGEGDNHNATYLSLNAAFTEKTGYTVTDRSGNTAVSDVWQKGVVSEVNGGTNSPDIIFYFSGSSIQSIQDNLVPLEELLLYTDNAYASNIKMLYATDAYAVPIKTGSQAVMYHKQALSAEDFLTKDAMFTALNAAGLSAAVSADLPHYWLNHLLVYYLGYNEYKAFNGTKVFFTEEKKELWANALLNALNDMRGIGFFAQAENNNGAESNAFWAGERSLSIDGQWTAASFEAAAAKGNLAFANFPAPTSESKGFYIGGVTTGWYVTKSGWANEKKRAAIIEYINTHTSDAALNSYCVAGGGTPANKKELTGAATAVAGFASVTYDKEELVAIDDRMSTEAKAALMGSFNTESGAPKLLAQESAVTKEQAEALLSAMIDKLI